ncbi:unnamed protein product [Diabrotica balteata]|uniref:Uncharacterized protein n=1 Tax=Diabrotica balteata TaxID=107213 RepID=A0A9N9SZ60_DIABA|nr:unnamed protein product [Diabrotica balteata]
MSDAMNNDELMLYLLIEEEDDDDLLLLHYKSKRKPTRSVFKNRQFDGSYSILIKNHLMANEDIFRNSKNTCCHSTVCVTTGSGFAVCGGDVLLAVAKVPLYSTYSSLRNHMNQ